MDPMWAGNVTSDYFNSFPFASYFPKVKTEDVKALLQDMHLVRPVSAKDTDCTKNVTFTHTEIPDYTLSDGVRNDSPMEYLNEQKIFRELDYSNYSIDQINVYQNINESWTNEFEHADFTEDRTSFANKFTLDDDNEQQLPNVNPAFLSDQTVFNEGHVDFENVPETASSYATQKKCEDNADFHLHMHPADRTSNNATPKGFAAHNLDANIHTDFVLDNLSEQKLTEYENIDIIAPSFYDNMDLIFENRNISISSVTTTDFGSDDFNEETLMEYEITDMSPS